MVRVGDQPTQLDFVLSAPECQCLDHQVADRGATERAVIAWADWRDSAATTIHW